MTIRPADADPVHPYQIITTLGVLQILAWGSSFYLLSVLAPAISNDMSWPQTFVFGGLSVALLVAGGASPRIGHTIQRLGGRPVLAASSLLFAGSLALLAAAPNLPVYYAAWAVMGLAMASGLYDPAFATLGRLYGHSARQMITAITLFGGLASTICWPLSAWLLAQYGWRVTALTYAGLHIFIGLPAYLLLLPKRPPDVVPQPPAGGSQTSELPVHRQKVAFVLLGAILTTGAVVLSLVSAHLLTLLQARGVPLAVAVALGALVGPSQIAARVAEMVIGRYFHPVWTMLAGATLFATGILLLWANVPLIAVALIAYGAGNGISSIVRGTVPLVLFGPSRYAILMGRLGLPSLLGMAAAPIIGALLIKAGGASLTFAVLSAISLLSLGLGITLVWWCKSRDKSHDKAGD